MRLLASSWSLSFEFYFRYFLSFELKFCLLLELTLEHLLFRRLLFLPLLLPPDLRLLALPKPETITLFRLVFPVELPDSMPLLAPGLTDERLRLFFLALDVSISISSAEPS